MDGVCVVQSPEIEDIWELDEGVSRIASLPSAITCAMSPEFRKDVGLADNLYGAGVPVISGRAKAILEREVTGNRIEYLPVRIMNHKKRVASADYFVLHPLDVCECIDLDKSGVTWNRITSNLISGCAGLVINEAAVPNNYKLFRLKFWGQNIMVTKELAGILESAGLTGLAFRDAAGYKGIG